MMCIFMRIVHKHAVLNGIGQSFDKDLTYLTKSSGMPLYKGVLASKVSSTYLTSRKAFIQRGFGRFSEVSHVFRSSGNY